MVLSRVAKDAVSLWAARLALALLILGGLPDTGFSQVDEAKKYGDIILFDNRPGYFGKRLPELYWRFIRMGFKPNVAFRSVYAYHSGWTLGYQHGCYFGAYKKWSPNVDQDYAIRINEHKSLPWSQNIWGMVQLGFYDGLIRGKKDGAALRIVPSLIPGIEDIDYGSYKRSLGVDPNDPWGDLMVREVITGPVPR